MKIKVLKAKHGDSFFIYSNNKKTNILVDGGPLGTIIEIKNIVVKLLKDNLTLDYIFITHIDDDHIHGIIDLFKIFYEDISIAKNLKLKTIFYNNFESKELFKENNREISFKQGNQLSGLINSINKKLSDIGEKNIKVCRCKAGDKFTLDDLDLKILTPQENELSLLNESWDMFNSKNIAATKENYNINIDDILISPAKKHTIINSSSISFLVREGNIIALFAGDANPKSIYKSLKKFGYEESNKINLDLLDLCTK